MIKTNYFSLNQEQQITLEEVSLTHQEVSNIEIEKFIAIIFIALLLMTIVFLLSQKLVSLWIDLFLVKKRELHNS
jgi:hypothetical protein